MTIHEFIPTFREDIAPRYMRNQQAFDVHGIHGVLHIARSLLIGNMLAHELEKKGVAGRSYPEIHRHGIFCAIGFHDSGRKGSGIDYWENISRDNCLRYLTMLGYNPDYCKETADMILKNNPDRTPEYLCVYDADVLDIMRPCTGIGVSGFQKSYLQLTGIFGEAYYETIIGEVAGYIMDTEGQKNKLSGIASLSKCIDIVQKNKTTYKLLNESL